MTKYKEGNIIKGVVTGIEKYGAFVAFDEFYSGLIHISEISYGFVKEISDYLKIGDEIFAEIIGVDDKLFHLKLSIKNINYRNNNKVKRAKIMETSLGFSTLAKLLPMWIEENLKNINKLVDK